MVWQFVELVRGVVTTPEIFFQMAEKYQASHPFWKKMWEEYQSLKESLNKNRSVAEDEIQQHFFPCVSGPMHSGDEKTESVVPRYKTTVLNGRNWSGYDTFSTYYEADSVWVHVYPGHDSENDEGKIIIGAIVGSCNALQFLGHKNIPKDRRREYKSKHMMDKEESNCIFDEICTLDKLRKLTSFQWTESDQKEYDRNMEEKSKMISSTLIDLGFKEKEIDTFANPDDCACC